MEFETSENVSSSAFPLTVDFNLTDGSLSSSNGTENGSLPYIPMSSRPERFLVPILFVLIFLVGIIGNGALVFFFYKYPQMRSVPNTYILSLAFGDILVLLFTVPFVSLIFTLEEFPFGEMVCKMQEVMKDISVGVTVFTLTALSVNRYYAIVHTFNQRSDGMKHTLLVTAFIWIFSILLSIPAAIFTTLVKFGTSNLETVVICFPYPKYLGPFYPKFSVLFRFLVYYFIPLVIISTYYILMARHLVTQDIPGECLPQQRTTHQRQAASRRKVAKLVLAFVLIFAVCFFPNNVFIMWFYFHPTAQNDYNYAWNSVRIIGFCLSFINSCINPIALYWISGTFRKHFNRHVFFCIRHDDGNVTSLSQYHFQSSTKIYANIKTENFEISSENGLDKVTT